MKLSNAHSLHFTARNDAAPQCRCLGQGLADWEPPKSRKMSKDVERCRKLWNARSSTGILTFDPSRSIWAWHGFCISGVLLPSSSSEHIRIISDLYHFSSRSPRSGEIPERSWKDFLQITCTVHRSGPHKFVSFGLCQFGERSWYPIKQKCGN